MKLYKDGKVMQNVAKEQVDICLDAGWSRTEKVEPEVEEETSEVEEETSEVEEEEPTSIRKKTGFKSIKSRKKK